MPSNSSPTFNHTHWLADSPPVVEGLLRYCRPARNVVGMPCFMREYDCYTVLNLV